MAVSDLIPADVVEACVAKGAVRLMAGRIETAALVNYLRANGWTPDQDQPYFFAGFHRYSRAGCPGHHSIDAPHRSNIMDYAGCVAGAIRAMTTPLNKSEYEILLELLAMQAKGA